MLITSLGHGTVSVAVAGTHVLVDPMLTGRFMDGLAAPEPQRDIDLTALPPVNAVVITHFHAGHLEPASLALLPRDTAVFLPEDDTIGAVLDGLGFQRTVRVQPGQPVSFGDGTMRFTGTGQNFPYVGALFQSPEGTFWYMGDRGDTLPLSVVDRIVDEVGGIDVLVPSHPSDFHSFLLHSTWDGGAEESEQHDAWLRRTIQTVERISPKLFVPATTNFAYVGRAEWMNRYMFPMRPGEFVTTATQVCPDLTGTTLAPGDAVELAARSPRVHREVADFVVARPGVDGRGLDPTVPVPPVVDQNPQGCSAQELRTRIEDYLTDDLVRWLDTHCGGYRELLNIYRRMNVCYRLTVVFADGGEADWRVRMSGHGAEVERIGSEPVRYQELHTRIAASTLDRWVRDEIPYFTANVDTRRSGALWALGRTADGAVCSAPVEARCLVSAHLMSERERLDAWLATEVAAHGGGTAAEPALQGGPWVRASPSVSVLVVDEKVLVRDADQRREIAVPPHQLGELATVLATLPEWTGFDDATRRTVDALGVDVEQACSTLVQLLEHELLELRDAELPTAPFTANATWRDYGWAEAYGYHRHIRAIPPPDWSQSEAQQEDMDTMRQFLAEEDAPSAYLERAALRTVELADSTTAPAVSLVDTITAPVIGNGIGRDELAWLVRLSFGQTGTRRLPVTGEHVVKTSPSGGSRHPTEVYPVVLPGGDLEAGVYHYNVGAHRLDLLREGDFTDTVRRDVIMLEHRPEFPPAVVFLLTSVVERSMFRYRDSRSYRVLYQDAGHLLQTFAYTASALGRPTYRGYTMRGSTVAELLGVHALEQLPLAYGVLG